MYLTWVVYHFGYSEQVEDSAATHEACDLGPSNLGGFMWRCCFRYTFTAEESERLLKEIGVNGLLSSNWKHFDVSFFLFWNVGNFQWTPEDVAKSLTCMLMSGPLLTGYTQVYKRRSFSVGFLAVEQFVREQWLRMSIVFKCLWSFFVSIRWMALSAWLLRLIYDFPDNQWLVRQGDWCNQWALQTYPLWGYFRAWSTSINYFSLCPKF